MRTWGLSEVPDEDVAQIYLDALQAYNDHMIFEMPPRSGGLNDQEIWWREGVGCIKAAKRDADRDRQARKQGNALHHAMMREQSEYSGQEWGLGTDRMSAEKLGQQGVY